MPLNNNPAATIKAMNAKNSSARPFINIYCKSPERNTPPNSSAAIQHDTPIQAKRRVCHASIVTNTKANARRTSPRFCIVVSFVCLQSANKNEYQDNHQHEAEAAAEVRSAAVEVIRPRVRSPLRKATDEEQHEKDDQNESEHVETSFAFQFSIE